MHPSFPERFFTSLLRAILYLALIFWGLLTLRLLTWTLIALIALSWLACPKLRKFPFKFPAFAIFFLAPFLPFDLSFINEPGPPRLKPLVMGLPSPATMERAEKGEVFLGGCMVGGFEPRWILVW